MGDGKVSPMCWAEIRVENKNMQRNEHTLIHLAQYDTQCIY